MKIFLIYTILLINIVFLKNLTLHDYDNPSANHILDVEIPHDNQNLLIVSGMLGGIEFYDISNPEILNHLDNLSLSGGGGNGGGGARIDSDHMLMRNVDTESVISETDISIGGVSGLHEQSFSYVDSARSSLIGPGIIETLQGRMFLTKEKLPFLRVQS